MDGRNSGFFIGRKRSLKIPKAEACESCMKYVCFEYYEQLKVRREARGREAVSHSLWTADNEQRQENSTDSLLFYALSLKTDSGLLFAQPIVCSPRTKNQRKGVCVEANKALWAEKKSAV